MATDPCHRPAPPTAVDIVVDPICPFAWLTSRWLAEVEPRRALAVTFRVMSLSVLNDGDGRTDLSEFYRDLIERGWGPARVAVAVEQGHGPEGLRRFYDAFGLLHHVGGRALDPTLIADALAAADLPASLAAGADDPPLDEALRASHHRGMDPVGDDVGTPVLHIRPPGRSDDPIAVFGPVVTPAPRGEDAARLWDGVVLVAGSPDFFELKRSRTRALSFR
ncbi:MAG: disulfide bond formation protein DsbA [Acidimicrobiales bacterium]